MIFKSRNKQEPVRKDEEPDRSKPARRSGPSIITEDVVLEGNLITSGELQINGTLHGDVRASGVVVDAHGSIHGEVVAEEVVVRGRIIGPIHAIHVHIHAGAHVEGDISHETISIENGAYMNGSVRRMEEPIEVGGHPVEEADLYLSRPQNYDEPTHFAEPAVYSAELTPGFEPTTPETQNERPQPPTQ